MADMVIMPRLSLNEETCVLSQWYVSEGDTVAVGDKLFCIETDKSTMDVDAEVAGTVLKKYYGDFAVVQVLTPVCAIGEAGEEAPELEIPTVEAGEADGKSVTAAQGAVTAQNSAATEQSGVTADPLAGKKGISPRAKCLAERNGVTEFRVIRPSGAENRILEEDILRFLANGRQPEVRDTSGEKRVVRLPKIRKVIAKNMLNSLQSTAQLTMTAVFNATGLQNMREHFKQEQGEMKKVTVGDLVLYAVSRTLPDFQYLNAWMENEEEVTEFADVNLGVAVDTERGLMVPTIRAAQCRTLKEISDELKDLAAECRGGSISPDKLREGTFTVTNLGAFGIETFTPVLNPPQVGILGVGTISYHMKKAKDGIVCYPACTLSLTVDHRYVDGGPAARFLRKLCENLENIEELVKEDA